MSCGGMQWVTVLVVEIPMQQNYRFHVPAQVMFYNKPSCTETTYSSYPVDYGQL